MDEVNCQGVKVEVVFNLEHDEKYDVDHDILEDFLYVVSDTYSLGSTIIFITHHIHYTHASDTSTIIFMLICN